MVVNVTGIASVFTSTKTHVPVRRSKIACARSPIPGAVPIRAGVPSSYRVMNNLKSPNAHRRTVISACAVDAQSRVSRTAEQRSITDLFASQADYGARGLGLDN